MQLHVTELSASLCISPTSPHSRAASLQSSKDETSSCALSVKIPPAVKCCIATYHPILDLAKHMAGQLRPCTGNTRQQYARLSILGLDCRGQLRSFHRNQAVGADRGPCRQDQKTRHKTDDLGPVSLTDQMRCRPAFWRMVGRPGYCSSTPKPARLCAAGRSLSWPWQRSRLSCAPAHATCWATSLASAACWSSGEWREPFRPRCLLARPWWPHPRPLWAAGAQAKQVARGLLPQISADAHIATAFSRAHVMQRLRCVTSLRGG